MDPLQELYYNNSQHTKSGAGDRYQHNKLQYQQKQQQKYQQYGCYFQNQDEQQYQQYQQQHKQYNFISMLIPLSIQSQNCYRNNDCLGLLDVLITNQQQQQRQQQQQFWLNDNSSHGSDNHNNNSINNNNIIKKKQKKDKLAEYNKNICGHITKKTLRQFISTDHQPLIQQLCYNYNAPYQQTIAVYTNKIQKCTGPTHIYSLLLLNAGEGDGNGLAMTRVFLAFFVWFLKEKYLRGLMKEGKMKDRGCYLQYKNRVLLPIVQKLVRKIEQNEGKRVSMGGGSPNNQNWNQHLNWKSEGNEKTNLTKEIKRKTNNNSNININSTNINFDNNYIFQQP